MTLRRPGLPKQVEHIAKLSKLIDESSYTFVTDTELTTRQQVPEGVWKARMATFINDPESGIGNDEYDLMYTRGLLTQKYSAYLSRTVVQKYTRCLRDPAVKQKSSEHLLLELKKVFKKDKP